ncbi:MAG: hypothetical protein R3C11_06075 [Planctomycetaceae bacterium]
MFPSRKYIRDTTDWTLQQRSSSVLIQNFKQLLLTAEKIPREKPIAVNIGTRTHPVEGWNRNRRREGFCDPDLTVTRIDSLAGKPVAVLVNFTAHPTFMSAQQMWFSAGWPGHLQRTLESQIGEGVLALYYNGAEGDQSPLLVQIRAIVVGKKPRSAESSLAYFATRVWKEPFLSDRSFFATIHKRCSFRRQTGTPISWRLGEGIWLERFAVAGNGA